MQPGEPQLTFALRELAWALDSERAHIAALSRRIDRHVEAVNLARRELAERLERLDEMVETASDPKLQTFLRGRASVELPRLAEHFPERLYPSA